MGIFGYFTEILIEKSSTFHITLVLIVEFDWLFGDKKGNFRKNVVKSSSQKP